MDNSLLCTHELSAGYNGKIIIGDINISAERGKILTLMGPNGSGKSTVLKTITKQLERISGTVIVNGKDIAKASPKELAKTISIVMTDRIDPELMTCRDIVETGRYPYTNQFGRLTEGDKYAVDEAMELTSVTELADRYFSQISDGQRQRVMLSRAICQQPDVLILDEPASFLDIHHKLELLNILKGLARHKNIAVVISMHELDLAQRISDLCVCVAGGKIDRCGTPEEIFTDEYIARLYGLPEGSYSCISGSAELIRSEGEPAVFVITAGGGGTKLFRQLNRRDIPFAAGVLHENDIDYPAARSLAFAVISEKPFEPVGEESAAAAKRLMDSIGRVICCGDNFGSFNLRNKELLEYAAEKGYIIDSAGKL